MARIDEEHLRREEIWRLAGERYEDGAGESDVVLSFFPLSESGRVDGRRGESRRRNELI